MILKKLLCLFLTVLCISLPGCGSSNAYNDTQILVNEAGSESGIENYNQEKIIEEYGKDIDSGLFLFPNQTSVMDEVLGVQYDIESYSLPAYVA